MVIQTPTQSKWDALLSNLHRPLRVSDFGDITTPEGRDKAKIEYHKFLCERKGLLKGPMLVSGLPRAGKTTWAVFHAKFLRDNFGIPCTFDFHPKGDEPFGPYEYFDETDLQAEVKKVTIMAKKSGSWDERLQMVDEGEVLDFAKRLKIYGHTLVLDEGTRWLSNKRVMSNVSLILFSILKQWAHYDMLFCLVNHFKQELNRDVLRYMDHQGVLVNCSWGCQWKDTGLYNISNNSLPGREGKMEMTLYGPNVWKYFNSFSPIAMPGRISL